MSGLGGQSGNLRRPRATYEARRGLLIARGGKGDSDVAGARGLASNVTELIPDRTGAAGASPMGPGPTERDPGPGRDSTWDPLNALGPTEPGPTEPKLKPPARVVTPGSYQI